MALPPVSNLKLNEIGSCLMVLLQQEDPQFAPRSAALQQEMERLQQVSLARAVSMIQSGGTENPPAASAVSLYRTNHPVILSLLQEYTLRLKQSLLLPEHARFLRHLLQQQQQQTPGASNTHTPDASGTNSNNKSSMYSPVTAKRVFQGSPQQQQTMQTFQALPDSPLFVSLRSRINSFDAKSPSAMHGDSESSWSNVSPVQQQQQQAYGGTTATNKCSKTNVQQQLPRQPTPSPTNHHHDCQFETEHAFVDFCRNWVQQHGSTVESLAQAKPTTTSHAGDKTDTNYTKQQLFTSGLEGMVHSYKLVTVGMQIRNSIHQWEVQTKLQQQSNSNTDASMSPTSKHNYKMHLKEQGDILAEMIDQWKTQVEKLGGRILGVSKTDEPLASNGTPPVKIAEDIAPPPVYTVDDDDNDEEEDEEKLMERSDARAMQQQPLLTFQQPPLKKRTVMKATTEQHAKEHSGSKRKQTQTEAAATKKARSGSTTSE